VGESENPHFRFRAEQMSTIVGGEWLGASVRSTEHPGDVLWGKMKMPKQSRRKRAENVPLNLPKST